MSAERHRPDEQGIKITREIPLYWLLGICALLVASIVQSNMQSQKQDENTIKLEDAIKAQSVEIRAVSDRSAAKDIVDALQDAQIRGHDAQIRDLQQKVK